MEGLGLRVGHSLSLFLSSSGRVYPADHRPVGLGFAMTLGASDPFRSELARSYWQGALLRGAGEGGPGSQFHRI